MKRKKTGTKSRGENQMSDVFIANGSRYVKFVFMEFDSSGICWRFQESTHTV